MKNKLSYLFSIFNFGSDLSIGIFTSVIFAKFFNLQLTPATVALSSFFTMLPDIDMAIEMPLRLLGKAKAGDIHQTFTHRPFLYYPLALVLAWYNFHLGLLMAVNVTIHFLHDSFATSWGIPWFWPIKKKYYKFFANEQGALALNFVQKWTPEQRQAAVDKYGDPHWMENLYVNTWRMRNFKLDKNGPGYEWVHRNYTKLRWLFYSEIAITAAGILTLFKVALK